MSGDGSIIEYTGEPFSFREPHKFLTIAEPGHWRPTYDFVYFRKLDKVDLKTKTGLVLPAEENMLLCECLAAGPGRALPGGMFRETPVRPGQYFILNGNVKSAAVVTEIMDDDGSFTYVVEGTYCIGARDDLPPLYAAALEEKRETDKKLELAPAVKVVEAGAN